MDDPLDIPQSGPDPTDPENIQETAAAQDQEHIPERGAELGFVQDVAGIAPPPVSVREDLQTRQRSFRKNLALLLSFSLAAFILTAWILVRVDSPFGMFSTGPQDVARAQLRALDRGELRPAYDMFSARYREQVSFDLWHELVITHWRMFHADVLHAGAPAENGPRVTIEIQLRGADDNQYRARYTMIRFDGRWWIDDVHWAEESNGQDFSRT